MHPNAILHEVQQLYNVSERSDSLAEQHPSFPKHSSPSWEMFATRPRCCRRWVAMEIASLFGLDRATLDGPSHPLILLR
jgi:hypothetical protein